MRFKKLLESLSYNPETTSEKIQDEMSPAEVDMLEPKKEQQKDVPGDENFDRDLNELMYKTPASTKDKDKALSELEKLLNKTRK